MFLSELLTALPVPIQAHQHWAITGPEAERFSLKFRLEADQFKHYPDMAGLPPDHVLLAGALSAEAEAEIWFKELLGRLPQGATLMVVDWQGDGPLDIGPDLERRFKRGKLCRLLREAGFSDIELRVDHPLYYVVCAVKRSPPPHPHAGEFVTVAILAELPKNTMKPVELFGQRIIVANTGQEIVAFAQACPHAGTSLDKGKFRGRHIICPLHYYMWNVRSGEPVEPADEDRLPCYPTKVDPDDGTIQVALSF